MYSEGLLKTIEDIDMMSIDSEISVLESMIDTYEKAISILEQSDDGTDVSTFDIFQEGEKWDKFKENTDAPIFGSKGESVGKRIAMVIPRLIAAIIRLCKKLFSKNKKITERMEADVVEMKESIQNPQPLPAPSPKPQAPKTPPKQQEPPKEEPKSQPEPEPESKSDEKDLDKSTSNLRANAPTENDEKGDTYKSIMSVLFANNESGNIDRVFLNSDWFDKCKSDLSKAFNSSTQNVTNLGKHLDVITGYVKSMSKVYNQLQVRYTNGGEVIKIKDSEFVAKMEEFEKKNKDDIDACNDLISYVENEMDIIKGFEVKDGTEEDSKMITRILRQYNRFLKTLNSYVTTIWQSWEHDKGARDQAKPA